MDWRVQYGERVTTKYNQAPIGNQLLSMGYRLFRTDLTCFYCELLCSCVCKIMFYVIVGLLLCVFVCLSVVACLCVAVFMFVCVAVCFVCSSMIMCLRGIVCW